VPLNSAGTTVEFSSPSGVLHALMRDIFQLHKESIVPWPQGNSGVELND
jgi:hypothetical protein